MNEILDSSELRELRHAIRRFAEGEIPKYQSDENYNQVPRELFAKAAELGLTGTAIPESFGGNPLSAVESAMVYYELARIDLGPAIFISVHNMVAGLLNRFGNDVQREKYLPKLASGEWLGAFGLTEPSAGSDAASLVSRAEKTADGFTLNGQKCWITSADSADFFLCFCRTGEGDKKNSISAFIVERTDKGVSIGTPEKKMGAELSPIASVFLENCEVPSDRLVGEIDGGYGIALGGLAGGRINVGAAACGVARCAVEKAYAYTSERKQFGAPIASFQGVQFMLADMQIELEAAEALIWKAASVLDADPSSRENRLLPSIAKCHSTDAAMKITTDAVQLYGGAGYVKDYPVEKLMRDAKMLQIVEGTNQIQRSVIARELEQRYGTHK